MMPGSASPQSAPHSPEPSRRRIGRRIAGAASIALALSLAGAGAAQAATLNVSPTGTDSAACGPAADPCATPQVAVDNAVHGDTVALAAGTYALDRGVAIRNKNITFKGAGIGQTILDGGWTPTTPVENWPAANAAGIAVRSTVDQSVTISDLTLQNMGKAPGASARRYGIWVQPQTGTPRIVLNSVIRNIEVRGTGHNDTGIYAANNPGTLLVDGLRVNSDDAPFAAGGNPLLLEKQVGEATIRNSSIKVAGSGWALFASSHGAGGSWPVTGRLLIENNDFDVVSGLLITSGFTFAPTLAAMPWREPVIVRGNRIRATGTAVSFDVTQQIPTVSEPGSFARVELSGNQLTARNAGSGTGVSLAGRIDSTLVRGNNIRSFFRGVSTVASTPTNQRGDVIDPVITHNQIVGNSVTGLRTATPDGVVSNVDATNNWWGCNAGPGAAGCDAVQALGGATVDSTPHIVFGGRATLPGSLRADEQSNVRTWLTRNSDGDPVNGMADVPGTPAVGFSATGGLLWPASQADEVGGAASATVPFDAIANAVATFESSATAGRSVVAAFDNASLTFNFTDVPAPPANGADGADGADGAKGDKGDKGDQGATGPQGPIGPQGPQGEVGPQGATGPQGPAGQVPLTSTTGQVPLAQRITAYGRVLQCTKSGILPLKLERTSKQISFAGITDAKLAGRTLTIRYKRTGKKVGTTKIGEDGRFETSVTAPRAADIKAGTAFYRLSAKGVKTGWLKATRRIAISDLSVAGRQVTVTGRLQSPLAENQVVTVKSKPACGKTRTIGTITPDADGRFSGTVTLPAGTTPATLRLQGTVAGKSGKTFKTYSLTSDVVIG